jgi:hypothetical protein
MANIPDHVQKELATLSDKQVMKFHELLAWSGSSGFPGGQVDLLTCDRVLDMVKRMGVEPHEAVAPETMPKYDMEFNKHVSKWFIKKK